MGLEEMLQRMYDRTADMGDIKKELKEFEKDTEQMKELKKMRKELNAQVKELKEKQEEEWMKDQYYKDLRDDMVKMQGDLKELKSKVHTQVEKLAAKGEHINVELTSGADTFRVQSKLEASVFINGRKAI